MLRMDQSLSVAEVGWINPPLDRTSPLPLYAQIKQRLIGHILRWDQPAVQAAAALRLKRNIGSHPTPALVFGAIREWKNNF